MYEVWIVIPGIAPEPDHWALIMTTTNKENALRAAEYLNRLTDVKIWHPDEPREEYPKGSFAQRN
jgi:hypothetical protein